MEDVAIETERICEFIKDTVKDADAKGVVLGLSGGLDSAVVLDLCLKALHLDQVKTYHFYIDDKTHTRLSSLSHKYHMFCKVYYSFDLAEPECADKRFDELCARNRVAYGNYKSRVMMANLRVSCELCQSLLVGATNKSEYMIGYFTKHGDGGCDFEPIQHLYKTEVYELARYLKVPKKILDAKPSAGLWEGQTDEGEIGMSYEKLDKIFKVMEYWSCRRLQVPSDYERLKRKDITPNEYNKVLAMIKASAHKRQLPRSLG